MTRHKLEEKTMTRHILPDISKNKDNQTMKYDELIKHNMNNIFL